MTAKKRAALVAERLRAAAVAPIDLIPIADLVPVCPNCHAILHHGVTEPRSVDELKALLAP